MTHVLVLLLALLIGVVAGLRSLTAPAVVSWAAFLGWINLHGTWASWMGNGAGVIGAVLGTMGGYQARTRLVAARGGHDLPIALLEDSVAVLGGFAIVAAAAAL